jgi:MFS family permease
VPTAPKGPFYGWYVAATAIISYFFTNGLAFLVPQSLAPRLMESFGATPAEIGRTTLVTFTLTALLAPFAGAFVDRLGVLRVIRAGLAFLVAAFACYPLARTMTALYLLHACFAIGLITAGLLVNVVLLSRWFVVRRGLAVGALVAGSSLAGATLPLAISPLVTNPAYGWRVGYAVLVLAFLILAVLPAFLVLRESPESMGLRPDGADAPPPAARPEDAPAGPSAGRPGERSGLTLREALATRTFWCLALGSACLWFAIQAVTSQITIFLEREAAFAPSQATRIFSLIFTLSFFGKFLYGAVSDWWPKRRVMLVAGLTLLAGCLLLFEWSGWTAALSTDPRRLAFFAIVFGLGFGGSFTMIQLTTAESFGERDLGKILGCVTLADGLAAGAGPAVAGQLATSTGGYLMPFAVVTGVGLLAVINTLLIGPPRCGQYRHRGARL